MVDNSLSNVAFESVCYVPMFLADALNAAIVLNRVCDAVSNFIASQTSQTNRK